jgi:hypothetical protein
MVRRWESVIFDFDHMSCHRGEEMGERYAELVGGPRISILRLTTMIPCEFSCKKRCFTSHPLHVYIESKTMVTYIDQGRDITVLIDSMIGP